MVLRSVRGRSLFLRFFAESGCGLILGREKKIKNWREIHPLDPLLVRDISKYFGYSTTHYEFVV